MSRISSIFIKLMKHIFRDEMYIKRALLLAERGAGRTSPNPMVGAVLVRRGLVVGEGFHKGVGLPHAEIVAIKNARGKTRGATLYVNLEPCAHFGKTPPCVQSIMKAGITRVVYAARDPNTEVHPRHGGSWLRRGGIKIIRGICEREARRLNEAFYTYHEKKRPFVAIKFATSLDGKMATRVGDSQWITGDAARAFARATRSRHDALVVGIQTVLRDNPHLGTRMKGARDPLRVILDPRLDIPLKSKVLRDNNVLIVTSQHASRSKKIRLEKRGIAILALPQKRVPVPALLLALKNRGVTSVLVEGGGAVLGSFIDSGAVDRVYAFIAPILIGGENAVTIGGRGVELVKKALQIREISILRFGTDILITGVRAHSFFYTHRRGT